MSTNKLTSSSPSIDENGLIKEGKATIWGGPLTVGDVFYNPVQVFNRDLSILAIRAFSQLRSEEETFKTKISNNGSTTHQQQSTVSHQEVSTDPSSQTTQNIAGTTLESSSKVNLKILEPLGATGLRSIRYALELGDVTELVVVGDMDIGAVRTMEANRERNCISENKLRVVCSDANKLMHFCHYGGVNASSTFILPKTDCSDSTVQSNTLTRPPTPSVRSFVDVPQVGSYFDVIDLDPYGSVSGFLDAAVQSVADGGMLCLTSTDMPILCGNNPETGYYKYGGTAVKARYHHEMSLRLLINAVSIAAGRHKRVVEPLLSCSVDFYVRCFVRIRTSAYGCKFLASQSSLAFQCTNCDAFTLTPLGIVQPKLATDSSLSHTSSYKFKAPQMPNHSCNECQQCGNKNIWIAGPFYSAPLYNRKFVDLCLALSNGNLENGPLSSLTMIPKIRGLLAAILEEDWESPLYYHLPSLMNRVKVEMIKTSQFKSALLHLGYRVSHFHREPQSIKTNASSQIVFDILRTWAKEHTPKSPEKYAILRKEIETAKICFDYHPDSVTKYPDICKWLPNPTPYWGPKARAKTQRAKNEIIKNEPSSKKVRV